MYRLRKIFKIPIGHRLSKHKGLCKNIHGHNLKIEVELKSDSLNENDMVLDFHDLKLIVNDLLKVFDHTTILNIVDKDNIEFFKKQDYRTQTISSIGQDPTAEVFAEHLYFKLSEDLRDANFKNNPTVSFIRVWENDSGAAQYSLS
jgi:6-pyruvoyltetrahydropterin/6-carboxytetrahydropterin synthase